jgi:microcompartment protein CcmL/EutN
MSQAIGILELTSIAKGMELGDAMLKSANVNLLVSKTICPGKFLLMLGGDIGAIQQAIETGARRPAKCSSTAWCWRIFTPASFRPSAA